VAWTWVTTAICLVWDAVVLVLGALIVTLESILAGVLSAIGFMIELVMAIPVVGTLVRWIMNGITHIISIFGSLVDAGLWLVGIRPEKKMRVCTVILSDERGNPVATVADAVALLQLAVDVYKRDANVRIVPSKAFKYTSGFGKSEIVDESWVTTDGGKSDSTLLDVPCGGGGAGADWLLSGSGFQWKMSTLCFIGSWRRVVGYGAPVTCFFIREVVGSEMGCALWITDYVTIEGNALVPRPGSLRTLGHELGHACNLTHACVDDDDRNIMATQGGCDPHSAKLPDRLNPRLSNGQAILVRMSKHVTYF
jgi:hypothetical protein